MILFVNACVRKDSRTRQLAEYLLSNLELQFACQFAMADQIVIAAPYWDLSFPAVLKQYLEQVSVVDITFTYTPEGIPKGLCKAKRLYYVTTAGGDYAPDEYGFGYVESLCKSLYGIQDVKLIKAVGLDIVGADVENILAESKKEIRMD